MRASPEVPASFLPSTYVSLARLHRARGGARVKVGGDGRKVDRKTDVILQHQKVIASCCLSFSVV